MREQCDKSGISYANKERIYIHVPLVIFASYVNKKQKYKYRQVRNWNQMFDFLSIRYTLESQQQWLFNFSFFSPVWPVNFILNDIERKSRCEGGKCSTAFFSSNHPISERVACTFFPSFHWRRFFMCLTVIFYCDVCAWTIPKRNKTF